MAGGDEPVEPGPFAHWHEGGGTAAPNGAGLLSLLSGEGEPKASPPEATSVHLGSSQSTPVASPTPSSAPTKVVDPGKMKRAELAAKEMIQKYGEGALGRLGSAIMTQRAGVEFIPTGSLSLDYALGGGWARGRASELAGEEGAGKTTLLYLTYAANQKIGNICAHVDIEHRFDPEWFRKCGGDPEQLFVSQPSGDDGKPLSAEKVIDMIRELLAKKIFDVIALDSWPAMASAQQLEQAKKKDGLEGKTYGGTAAVGSQMQIFLGGTGELQASKCSLLIVNQVRDKMTPYGARLDTPGGHALKHMFSQRMFIMKGEYLEGKEQEDAVTGLKFKPRYGQDIVGKVEKNSVGEPYRRGRISIIYEFGPDTIEELATLCLGLRYIVKSGSWYKFADPATGELGDNLQGWSNVVDHLRENTQLERVLRAAVMDAIKKGVRL